MARHHGVTIHHNKRMIDARNTGTGVTARFEDGSEATGDILIGADGIHSKIRKIIDPTAPAPRYVPLPEQRRVHPGLHRRCTPTRLPDAVRHELLLRLDEHPRRRHDRFANPPMKDKPARGELAKMTDKQWRRWLHKLLDGDVSRHRKSSTPVQDLCRGGPPTTCPWSRWAWAASPMMTIRDPSCASSPAAGQGASMSLEDAVILAQCLRDSRPHTPHS
jgi:2-polyprenyl-6-methoxyphenol hydroxylase-like FAD-dependent oxidoreductase